ncbi:MAG: glutathione S-transferase [Hyphomicrobiaceae bacterium]|jgi:glutathione S-transferase
MTHLHYFKGRGRAETTRWMLAINRIEFENVPIETPEALAALRASGKLPFDQMPLLEINGLRLSQSSAMIRYLARLGGFYGASDIDAVWCDMIAGAAADFAEAAMQAAFQPTEDIAIAALRTRFEKFSPTFEARLTENGTGFCVGERMTFADVVLAEALSAYLEWCPDILANTPLLDTLHERVSNAPGVASYLHSAQRYSRAGDDYVIDIARVLQRALPPHMPDAGRFISVE